MNPSIRLNRRQGKITPQLVIFLVIVSFPFFWFAYYFLKQNLTHGIERHGDYSEVDLKAMGNFSFEKLTGTDKDIPQLWRQLDGKRVLLEGFIYAPDSAGDNIDHFQFVYNITKCCFNGPPLVQERVFVRVPKGTIPYYGELCRITGILHVQAHREEGSVISVYTLDLERAEVAQ